MKCAPRYTFSNGELKNVERAEPGRWWYTYSKKLQELIPTFTKYQCNEMCPYYRDCKVELSGGSKKIAPLMSESRALLLNKKK